MTTPVPAARVLLIGNELALADEIRATLALAIGGSFDVDCVRCLSEGLERLREKAIAVVLLELSLPDSEGIATFDKLFAAAPEVPILILGSAADEALAKKAVGRGAQDYLLPTQLDEYSLPRAIRNAMECKTDKEALYLEKERALITLNSIGDAVLCTDMFGKITYLNVVAETMTGWNRQQAMGQPLAKIFRIVDGSTRKAAQDPMELAMEQDKTVGLTANCMLVRRDGLEFPIEDSAAPIHDRAGCIVGAVIVFRDASAARAIALRMAYTAHHDAVTTLPNRLLFGDRVSQSIALARRQKRSMAVIFLDLDRFKYINDSLGHAVGDKLLLSVSQRLLASVRCSDTVSRQGGDEFVVLLSEITNPEDAATSANKMLLAVSAPHSIENQTVYVDGSIGISVYPQDGEDTETLIKNADTAMYHAKEKGRNNLQFFKAEMNLKAVERQSLEGSLRAALERQEFLLHYQPKLNLVTGKITGVEALLRWRHPDRGFVPPSQFVRIAEDCGLIVPIGRWALREACRQARAWQDANLAFKRVSVNLSAVEFRHWDFVESVRTILSESGLEGRYLDIELTERILMEHADSAASVLPKLKMMGVHLAVDDFGTGYSSLSYLRQFPIDILKIDQSFVHQISSVSDKSPVVSAIIAMGKNLDLRVIAEGIETQPQLAYLQSRHCAEGQGYLFSPPLAATQCSELLAMPRIEICREPPRHKAAQRTAVPAPPALSESSRL
jgi:diguanylate cyclase (GGDEF)-like protein/PAS domain S-box-containing protein